MVQIEEMFMIKELSSKGMYIKDIAELTGRDPKTIRKYINAQTVPKYKEKSKKGSKLDPFKTYILNRMQEGCINAVVILEEIQGMGYTGKATILREFMKPHRKKTLAKASIRYETPPGKQTQVDWGEFTLEDEAGKVKKIHGFVMVMGYSRKMYL